MELSPQPFLQLGMFGITHQIGELVRVGLEIVKHGAIFTAIPFGVAVSFGANARPIRISFGQNLSASVHRRIFQNG